MISLSKGLLCAIVSCTVGYAQNDSEKISSFPLFEYLPNGTALNDVVIPTYDDLKNPTSVLKAEQVTVIDKEKGIMRLENSEVEVFDAANPYRISLVEALFDYKKEFLDGSEKLTVVNDSMLLQGTGVLYDFKKKELFVKGPSKALFTNKDFAMNLKTTALALMSFITTAQAAPPNAPSGKLLESIEEVKNTTDITITSEVSKLELEKKELSKNVKGADQKLSNFLNRTDRGNLLIKNEENTKKEPVKIPPNALVITCDDGMYYDSEEGIIVCLKNVKIEEPRFSLSCDDQLKIFLTKQAQEEKKKDEGSVLGGFGKLEMKDLFATGSVVLTYKNKNGKAPIIAKGDSAHFEMATEEILLEGDAPSVKQGNKIVEALEPNWFRLSEKGFLAGPGKKRTIYVEDE